MNIRTLAGFERDAVKRLYLALSVDDRRRRFCTALTDEYICKYVDVLDFERQSILGAFDTSGQLVGLAELALGAKESELAFLVRPDRRCRGLGTELMEGMLLRARVRGIRKVVVMFLSDNTAMRKMAMRAGMLLKTNGGEIFASLELPVLAADDASQGAIEEAVA